MSHELKRTEASRNLKGTSVAREANWNLQKIKDLDSRKGGGSISNESGGIFAKLIVAGSETIREKGRKFRIVKSECS